MKMYSLWKTGRVLEIGEDSAKITGSVPAGKVMVDGLGIGDVGSIVLKDRQHLAQDGLIIVVLAINGSTGEIISGPEIISRGFVYIRESENLMEEMKQTLRHKLGALQENHITDWAVIKLTVKDTLRDFLLQRNRRNPMVLPIIMEV